MLRVDVVSIFPDLFGPYLSEGMLAIARRREALEVHVHDLRDYTTDKHKSVDDRPYGGGPGMVMMPGPVFDAVEGISAAADPAPRTIMLTPQGRHFDQACARELAGESRLLLICGRYEGFDERIRIGLEPEELSIGDYVLTGGELPALVVIDAVARLLPGVLGHEDSAKRDSFSEDRLDCPQYTRPAEFRGLRVPDVLLSGNHAAIEQWRRERSLSRTRERRPDILPEKASLTSEKD
ncbi:MAG: tRNA (guanosine(37)-N1)-methyltransferase TrmD [Planctomycetota bacterium]